MKNEETWDDTGHPQEHPSFVPDKLTFGTKRFGELLIEDGAITDADLTAALERQRSTGERIGEALVNAGVIEETEIVRALARQLDLDVFDMSRALDADPEIILLIPEQMAKRHRVFAFAKEGGTLSVAMVDPLDLLAIDDVRVATKCELRIEVGCREDIEGAIARAYQSATAGQHFEEAIEGAELELGAAVTALEEIDEQELRNKAEDAPIVRLVDLIMAQAIADGATDVHIEPLVDKVVVRFRIDGVLYDTLTPPKQFRDAIMVRIKILSDMDVAERRIPLDGRFTARFEGNEVDVRVSSLPTVYGEKMALRLLRKSGGATDIEKLGFEPDTLKSFRAGLRKPWGMVLVSGPTGSGKSTSLYAGLSELDRVGKNITTLEDPVEYHLGRMNQVNINAKAGMTFAAGLRALMRQDPDIIMIGEIRDLETAELAVRAALTGHLVLSTVHANDSAATLTRLIDIGIESYLVTSAAHVVMAQRLVRRICSECKEPYEPDPVALRALGEERFKGVTFYHGAGCKQCKGRGYKGRVGLYELLEISPEIAQLALQNASAEQIRSRALEMGLVTLKDSAIQKVIDGVTTVEEVLAIAAESG
jgi:type IV pilus assembly protein PilB